MMVLLSGLRMSQSSAVYKKATVFCSVEHLLMEASEHRKYNTITVLHCKGLFPMEIMGSDNSKQPQCTLYDILQQV